MTIIVGKPLGDGSYTHQLPGTTPLERIVCGPRELRLEAELIFGGKFLRKRYWLFRRGKRPLIVCVFNVPQSS